VKEFKTGSRISSKLRIILNFTLEFSLKLRVLFHHFAGKFFEHVSFAVFLLLEGRVEESPRHCGIRSLGFKPLNADLRQPRVERHHYRSRRIRHRLSYKFA